MLVDKKPNGAFTLKWREYYFCGTESLNDHKDTRIVFMQEKSLFEGLKPEEKDL